MPSVLRKVAWVLLGLASLWSLWIVGNLVADPDLDRGDLVLAWGYLALPLALVAGVLFLVARPRS